MKALKTLVFMQLKDKLDLNFSNWKKVLFKSIFALLKFVIITGIIFLGFYLLSIFRLTDLTEGISDNFLLVIFTVMMLLSILTCTIGLVKSLYYAKDNPLLLTMPTNRVNIFFSKLIVYYIYELIRNITFLLPIFIAFGIVNSYTFLYYFWIIVSLFNLTAISVITSALLSIPAMYISNFFRNYKVLQYIVIIALLGLGIYGVVSLINLIPENFNIVESWGTTFWEIQAFLNNFAKNFIVFKWILEGAIGKRYGFSHTMFYANQWYCILGSIGYVLVVIGLCYLVVRPLFFKIASSPFEYKKSQVKQKNNYKKLDGFWSGFKKETTLIFRTPEKMYSLIGVAVGMPIAILLLNKIFNAMSTKLTGTYMTIMFNILMILLIALSSSTTMARVYSEEGHSAYLMKTNPQPYFKSLITKIMPNAVVMTVSILVTSIIFGTFGGRFVNTILLFLAVEGFYLGHLFWSAELDLMNPQTAQYATTGTHTNNPNEVKATLYAFILAGLSALVTYFLLQESIINFWIKAAVIGIVFMAVRIYLYTIKIKVYYKEK